MRRLTLWVLLLLAFGCAGAETAVKVDEQLAAADCASPQVQRLLTFCASPRAADLALRNAELMALGGDTTGEVSYSPLPTGDSPARGPQDAPVTIVMFTDLECPFCHEMHENLKTLMAESPQDIRLVFKHMPLSFHPNAVPAALAALAAREQGKFWEYVDKVYAERETLSREALLDHAAAVGLDTEQFRNDFGSQPHIGAVEADLGLASQVGVRGTPTIFVNGQRIVGLQPIESIRALVDQQKELAKRLLEAGVPQDDIYWRLVAMQYEPVDLAALEGLDDEVVEPEPVVTFIPTDGAPARGAAEDAALVTIVEFSDFQCPFCARANVVVDQLMEKYGADARLVFRHFPLPMHPDALPAAAASVAAQEVGKFWELHDLLFAGQEDLSREAILAYAKEAGLDPGKVDKALDDEAARSRVADDQALGTKVGVGGTPTFFVNGIMMLGIESPAQFAAMIEEQIELARTLREETGLVGTELYRAVVEHNKAAVAEP